MIEYGLADFKLSEESRNSENKTFASFGSKYLDVQVSKMSNDHQGKPFEFNNSN